MSTLNLKSHQLANHLVNNTSSSHRLCQRYEQLFRSEKYCDCVFYMGDGGIHLKGHKLILSAASPVFEAMFYGPLRENGQEIKIMDIAGSIFHILLRFIYTGCVDFEQLSLEDTIELYYGAEKYMLSELSDDCLMAVKGKLRFNNILPALDLCVCMNTQTLLEVCLEFFSGCCLCDPQYMLYLKHNYVHVSKECIKVIIANHQELKRLLWFVSEWCMHECTERFLHPSKVVDLQDELLNGRLGGEAGDSDSEPSNGLSKSIERNYYKACRPFNVSDESHEWLMTVISDRFISLLGIIIQSRLTPSTATYMQFATEYEENLEIEISSRSIADDDDFVEVTADQGNPEYSSPPSPLSAIVWRYNVKRHPAKYNCDLHIEWKEGIILSPDIEYQIKLIWQPDTYGAEYPCSLLSNQVDGIQFKDFEASSGSIIKGLHYLNLLE